MLRFVLGASGALVVLTVLASAALAQTDILEPMQFASGTVLDFHLHTRLHPSAENETDLLPKGTVFRVRLLDPIDSETAQDGAEFRGVVVSPVVSGNETIVHSESGARVFFVVLRSRSHPQGFRYELLVTSVTDHGKSFDLTASLNASFADGSSTPDPGSKHTTAPGRNRQRVPGQ